jgi:aspartyl-tRNA synthetase
MTNFRRTHDCGSLRKDQIGEQVRLSGWVHRRRDHGGLIFIDLRDRYGITQLVFDPDVDAEAHESANRLRAEWVISASGGVIPRAEGMTNPRLATGEIEVKCSSLDILSKAKTPPFSVCDERIEVSEDLRLKYRFLDIRRGEIADTLKMRHQVMLEARTYLDEQRFLEISTPLLGRSTPEGARDYLVPSRVHPGQFYALPQSPQIFKQLLMVSGMDRYFQIAPCFRDEDLRADRQPEFHQIDVEMSFGTPDDLFGLMEGLMARIYKKCLNLEIPTPFRRLTYKEVMDRFGTDKPDMRFEMELVTVSDIAERSDFTVFREQIATDGLVKGLCVKGGSDISRKGIDTYTQFVGRFGPKGLAWMKVTDEGLSSNIVKFFSPELQKELLERFKAEPGDLLFFVADAPAATNQALDQLRRLIARDRELIDASRHEFLWVTEFPLLHFDETSRRLVAEHHPFTAPHPDDIHLLETEPLKVRSGSYDLVLNGYELGSGSPRIYDGELQSKIFETLEFTPEEIDELFGFFVQALQYGTPPHLGVAFGLDRLIMVLTGATSIRDVVAFPKTQRASDLMMEAPSPVSETHLEELRLRIDHQT